MRCETFLDSVDRLDAGALLSSRLQRHYETCPDCRRRVESERAAIARSKTAEGAQAPASSAEALRKERIMAIVRLVPLPRREIRLREWLVPGILVASSAIFLPLSQAFPGHGTVLGGAFAFPIALVFGTLMALFGSLFIGSHFDELQGMLIRFQESRDLHHGGHRIVR